MSFEVITSARAYEILEEVPYAKMLDIRTYAQAHYVGIPKLDAIGDMDVPVIPYLFDNGKPNPDFLEHVQQEFPKKDNPMVIICRAGKEAPKAAAFLAEHLYDDIYVIDYGFEGERDSDGHRSSLNGWRFDGLPWFQS